MLNIYTSQILEGKNVIDVSLHNGLYIFKPYKDYYKNANAVMVNEMELKDLLKPYLNQMRQSYDKNTELWTWLLNRKTIILGCDCGHMDKLCHAQFLAQRIFSKLTETKYFGWIRTINN